ncbi:MAG: hypothetical protein C5B60_07585 [Chloroflexi bacterium]|nr:MAG: hypothetical protein C5B60_07585 [Chloroflexota bacterium]
MRASLRRLPPIALLNSLIKGLAQERFAKRAEESYSKEALMRGIRVPDDKSLKSQLQERLAKRGVMHGWPRRKGQLHIFLAFPATNWELVLPRAFRVFGKVTVFEWRSLGFEDGSTNWLARRDVMNKVMLETFVKANSKCPIDAVVGYLSGYTTSPETLAAMVKRGAAVFNFSYDDKLHLTGGQDGGRYRGPAALAKAVDLSLTSSPESALGYAIHGGLALFHAEAADPLVHRPYNLPFEYDVTFIGANYGWRPHFIKRLGKFGVRVECFGDGWPNGPVKLEDMAKIYSCSRINLGFGGIGHSRRLVCLKGRDFEVPMSGGLYLTQYNPELARVFNIGKEIVTYADERDCALKIKQLLEDEAGAALIRKAGYDRAIRDHTYEARWERVFTYSGLLESMQNGSAKSMNPVGWPCGASENRNC